MPEQTNNSQTIEYVVSNRSHEFIYNSLRLTENNFSAKSLALSIGEGLSDFASKLHEKGIKTIAVDPLYSIGKKIFGKSVDETWNIINDWYKEKVAFRDYRHETGIPGMPKEPLVSGNVYSLPFQDKSFSHLFGHRIFEHIDLSKALPEMLRVLRGDGEIRLGGVQLSAIPKDERLMTGTLQYSPDSHSFYYNQAKKMNEAFSDLSAMPNPPSIYVVLDCLPRMTEVQDQGAYVAGLMIIRKDNIIPEYAPIPNDTSPFLGKMYKVDLSSFTSPQSNNEGYYKLTPINKTDSSDKNATT